MSIVIFDRQAVRLHRDRAASVFHNKFDFLKVEVGKRLVSRLDEVRRTFPIALDLGCHGGLLRSLLQRYDGIETLVQTDLSPAMATLQPNDFSLAADEETLPFAENVFDLALSNLSLHWANDLPGSLIQIRKVLKPDGLFLAALFGGDSLKELRIVLTEVEEELEGKISPRISPFIDIHDAGNLLIRAGFVMPVADVDTITISYADPLRLMIDLRGMGETNTMLERKRTFSRRAMLTTARARYIAKYGDETGRVPATFQILYLLGWAPISPEKESTMPCASYLTKISG